MLVSVSILISSQLGARGAKSCEKIDEVSISIPALGSAPDRNSLRSYTQFNAEICIPAIGGPPSVMQPVICKTDTLRNHGSARRASELLLVLLKNSL